MELFDEFAAVEEELVVESIVVDVFEDDN